MSYFNELDEINILKERIRDNEEVTEQEINRLKSDLKRLREELIELKRLTRRRRSPAYRYRSRSRSPISRSRSRSRS